MKTLFKITGTIAVVGTLAAIINYLDDRNRSWRGYDEYPY